MRININLASREKKIFIPKTPITVVSIEAKKKNPNTLLSQSTPYTYEIKLKHGKIGWKVERFFKNFNEAHQVLMDEVKKEIGEIKFVR